MTWTQIVDLLGGLGLFLYGMHVMSDRIHKRSGLRLKKMLSMFTRNRFVGVFTGLGITSIVQSSSATTVLLVSLVNAGLVTLEQSIGVIMGANIGTTLTAWIVSLVGFEFKIALLSMPAIAIGLPLYFHKREAVRETAEILIGFGVLFLGLSYMKGAVPDLEHRTELFTFVEGLSEHGALSVLGFVLLGTIVTIALQSSSAAMAVTLALAYKGWIGFEGAAGIVLGENIGTTITAYLASLGMSVNAKRAARAHMLFNIIGVTWIVLLFLPFLRLTDWLVPGSIGDSTNLPIHLSAFHSLFNITNTALMIGFVPALAKLVTRMVKEPPRRTADRGIPFIWGTVPEAVESNLVSARAEIAKLGDIVHDMLLETMNIIPDGNGVDVEEAVERIKSKERMTDEMQEDIIHFLTECTIEALSERQARNIYAAQRITNELESIADSCENMVRLLNRRSKKDLCFHESGVDELLDYTGMALDFLRYNSDYLSRRVVNYDLDSAFAMEKAINKKRKKLRKTTGKQLQKGADVRAELLFIDLVKNLEHVGDYSLNISQAMREIE